MKHSTHPLYGTWAGMLTRCRNPNSSAYKNYGGRGIHVCSRWQGQNGFEEFVADMGDKPTPAHTLDRIDNNKSYQPDNCRWATRKEQMANARPRGDNSRNTSGIRGVHFDTNKKLWRGAKMQNGKRVYTRYFKTKEEAHFVLQIDNKEHTMGTNDNN